MGICSIYFLPVYFQAVKGSTPFLSSIQVLPTFMLLLSAAIIGEFLTTNWGRYPLHMIGYALMSISYGLLATLTTTWTSAEWVLYQAISAIGSGLMISSLLGAIQANLDNADNASSTAVFAFIQNFGAVWGLTTPAAVFNNQFNRMAYRITDPSVRALLVGGNAYSHVSRKFIYSFPEPTRNEIVQTYIVTLKLVWEMAIPICRMILSCIP